jgi:hypothetical protein
VLGATLSPRRRVALGSRSVNVKVSAGSYTPSSTTGTLIVAEAACAGIVSTPLVAT